MRAHQKRRSPAIAGRSSRHHASQRGFSLVELVVVLAVMSILAAIAAPQIAAVINGGRITANANEVLTGLQLARVEAIRANRRTVFCSKTISTAGVCDGGAAWPGWAVYTDRNGNNAFEAAELVRAGNIEAPIQAVGTNLPNNRVMFRADGLAYQDNTNTFLVGTLRICQPTDNPPQNARDIRIASGGRAFVGGAIDASTACNASAN